MSESFKLGELISDNHYWEVVVEGDTVNVYQRHKDCSIRVLTVRATASSYTDPYYGSEVIQEVEDWWGWGRG